MAFKSLLGTIGFCLFVSSFSSHAALMGRDLDGDNTTAEAYYDTVLKITWLADANINGDAFWTDQINWVNNLNRYGVSGWRLPNADVNGDGVVDICSSSGCIDNEMGYLFWQEGITSATPEPFSNVEANWYWSLTDDGASAYATSLLNGSTTGFGKANLSGFAWAVQDGILGESVIPIPAAVWLFGSGLIGLVGLARRKKA